MTISNNSNFTNLSLITIQNITPLNFIVDSQFLPTVKISVLNGATSISPVIATVEMLNYKQENNNYYFTIDLRNILATLFNTDSYDDVETGSNTWVTIPDNIFDIYIIATASNGVDANVNKYMLFSVCNASTEFGGDNLVSHLPVNIYDNTTDETYYAGANNVVYLYQYCRASEQITITPESDIAIFTDTNEVPFADNNENILVE